MTTYVTKKDILKSRIRDEYRYLLGVSGEEYRVIVEEILRLEKELMEIERNEK